MAEIARLFGLEWHELPALVIGTDPWTGEALLSGTGAWHVVGQMQLVTSIARRWGQPGLGRIGQALTANFPFDVRYVSADGNGHFLESAESNEPPGWSRSDSSCRGARS